MKRKQIRHSTGVPEERLASGVHGLDQLLKGGLPKGNLYLLMGVPGSGKTILGNQISFYHAKSGHGTVLYVTLIAESHTRMIRNLRSLDFFQEDLIARSIHYLSGYHILEAKKLKGLLVQIAKLIIELKATLLVIDGLTTVGDLSHSDLEFRKFTHELGGYLLSSGCTALLLSSKQSNPVGSEFTTVDGIFVLHYRHAGLRAVRQIEIRKFRGSDHLYGKHSFKITSQGVRIFPRTEALPPGKLPVVRAHEWSPFNIPGLDQMLGGGILTNSTTTLIGPAGTGKTILGLQFLRAGIEANEPAVFFGFYESPEELLDKAKRVGIQLEKAHKTGLLTFLWYPPLEQELDELAETLISTILKTKAKRVVIDAVDGFRFSAAFPNRVDKFVVALTQKIKCLGVTLVLIEETSLFQTPLPYRVAEMPASNENLLYLRHLEIESRLVRAISILKVRKSLYDPSIREMKISENGIEVADVISDIQIDRSGQIASSPVSKTATKRGESIRRKK